MPIIRHHHEHWNGTGYPDRLAGEAIPLLARVLQVVDVYDALRTERPYKPAHTHQQALETMRAEAQSGLWDGNHCGRVLLHACFTRTRGLSTHFFARPAVTTPLQFDYI